MRELKRRLGVLEAQLSETHRLGWVRVTRMQDQSEQEVIAAYEAAHGKIGGAPIILRSFI